MSDDYAHHAGRTADPNYAPGSLAEQRAYGEGTADRYDRAIGSVRNTGGGGSGTLILPLLVAHAALFWPLVTALALVAAYVAWHAVNDPSATEASLRPLLAAVLAGGTGLFIGIRIERVLQRSALYRGGRRLLRLGGAALGTTWLLLQYPGTPAIPPDWKFAWVSRQLSPFQWVLIAAVVVGTHVLSRRMDGELSDSEDDDSDYDIEAEDTGDRWRRRGRSLVFSGVAGALLVPLLAFESDNMFPAFVVGGVCGAVLSRWLYPVLVHPVWQLLPWVYFGARSRRSRSRRRQSSAGAA